MRAAAANVSAPTLVVLGGRHSLIPRDVGDTLASALPDAEIVVLDRAGHVPMFDQPEAFNSALLRFVAR